MAELCKHRGRSEGEPLRLEDWGPHLGPHKRVHAGNLSLKSLLPNVWWQEKSDHARPHLITARKGIHFVVLFITSRSLLLVAMRKLANDAWCLKLTMWKSTIRPDLKANAGTH